MICSWVGYVADCYIFHSTSLENTFGLFDSTRLLNVVHDRVEELGDEMESEDLGKNQNEDNSLAQKCFVDGDDERIADISNEMDWWAIQILSNWFYS